jgi:hypothetical protein
MDPLTGVWATGPIKRIEGLYAVSGQESVKMHPKAQNEPQPEVEHPIQNEHILN